MHQAREERVMMMGAKRACCLLLLLGLVACGGGGQLHLALPTWHTLMALADAAAERRLFSWASTEAPTTNEPVFARDNDELCLLLPGDPDYPGNRPVAGETRIAFRDGAWCEVGDRARRVPET